MPKYHFLCETCGSEFSESLPMGTLTPPSCPTCRNAAAVRKILRAPMVHFKGSGFYKTDSSGGMKPKPAAEPTETKTPEAKPEAKTVEAKPAEKSTEPKK